MVTMSEHAVGSARINIIRLMFAGLAAGVVANIVDMTTGLLFLQHDAQETLRRIGLDPNAMNTVAGMMPWVAVDLVYGLLIVFTYVGMRPRFGPGPKTALIAGAVLWTTVTAFVYGFTTLGMLLPTMFFKSSAFAILTTAAASLAGGAIYRE